MNHLLTVACSLSALAQLCHGQWEHFIAPSFSGTTQYSEWDVFTTTNEASPDVAGSEGRISENANGLVSSSLNIYSFSSNLDLSLTGSSDQGLGQIQLQILTWGQLDPLLGTPSLTPYGGTSLPADQVSTFFDQEVMHPSFGLTQFVGYTFYWDFSALIAPPTTYTIDFDLEVHTSLDRVRLDTTTEPAAAQQGPELAVILPIQLNCAIINGDMVLSFESHMGNSYQVKWTSDLTTAGEVSTWNDLGGNLSGNGEVIEVIDEESSENAARFYAVIITNS